MPPKKRKYTQARNRPSHVDQANLKPKRVPPMSKKTNDAISRSDRVLVAAMAIILATASAAIGASLTYHPHTNNVGLKPVAKVAELPKPATDVVMTALLAEHKCL